MIRHVASQRSDRNIAILNRTVVGTVFGIFPEVLLANPKVRLAARIDVFGNHRPGVLDSLARNPDALDLSEWDVDVQKRPFGQSFTQYLLDGEKRKPGGFLEIKVLARYKADGDSGHSQNGRL